MDIAIHDVGFPYLGITLQPTLCALPGIMQQKPLAILNTFISLRVVYVWNLLSCCSSLSLRLGSNLQEIYDESPCDKLGSHLGYLFRNLVACAGK